jgi:hypothetical protein
MAVANTVSGKSRNASTVPRLEPADLVLADYLKTLSRHAIMRQPLYQVPDGDGRRSSLLAEKAIWLSPKRAEGFSGDASAFTRSRKRRRTIVSSIAK